MISVHTFMVYITDSRHCLALHTQCHKLGVGVLGQGYRRASEKSSIEESRYKKTD